MCRLGILLNIILVAFCGCNNSKVLSLNETREFLDLTKTITLMEVLSRFGEPSENGKTSGSQPWFAISESGEKTENLVLWYKLSDGSTLWIHVDENKYVYAADIEYEKRINGEYFEMFDWRDQK